MATIWITEYAEIAEDSRSKGVLVGKEPAIDSFSFTYTTTTQSRVLSPRTHFIRVKADADAHIVVGENPVATAQNTPVEANVTEYFGIQVIPGRQLKIAAYDGTS